MQVEETRLAAPELEGHLPGLDGVRGLAILVVMIGHFNIGYHPAYLWERGLKDLILTGWWGVDLFFVLSGFLITGILLDAKGGNHYFRNFYVRRVLRIFPLYYGFLFAFFVVAPMIRTPTPGGPFDAAQRSQGWFWSYLSNYMILFPHWVRPYPLTHMWTLAVEEQFYLFWPAVVFLTSRKGLLRVCILCVVGSFLFRMWLYWIGMGPTAGYRLTPARLDTLAIGALLAVLVRQTDAWVRIKRHTSSALVLTLLAIVALSIPTRGLAQAGLPMLTVGYPLLATFSAGLIVFALDPSSQDRPLGRFFRLPFMRLLGKYSYAMYIFHFPLGIVLPRIGVTVQRFPRVADSELPGAIAFSIIGITVSWLAALVSWHFYEKHFLSLKRFFPRKELHITNLSSAEMGVEIPLRSPLAVQPREPGEVL